MATARKKAPAAKTTGTALTLWEQEMAAEAAVQASAEKPTGFNSSISFKSGVMTIDEAPVAGNELDVVILAAVHENQYYTGAYNPAVIQTPDCYAIGTNDDEMAPHKESEAKQGDDNGLCANCWANKMGSADVGRGKACKNVRRIVVVPADALESLEAFKDAELRTAKIPVMSVKGLGTYIRNTLAEELKRPTWGVVSTMKVVPDAKSQFKVNFAFQELINFDQDLYDAVKKRAAEAQKTLLEASYPKFTEEVPVAPPARGARPPKYQQKPAAPAAKTPARGRKAA